ncbi:MAG: TlpA disulfide reductase family protein [Telluria sp.]
MTRNNLVLYSIVGLVCAGVGAYVALHRETQAPQAVAVAAAPLSPAAALFAQSMNDASGTRHALGRWKGKPLVVNFWAPWCAPCVQEMPELSQLAVDNAVKGINVIGIGIDSPTNIAEFASKLKIAYPLYVAGMSGTDLSRQFGNSNGGLPYTVLIGADGKVVKTYLGKLKFDELKADLAKLKS